MSHAKPRRQRGFALILLIITLLVGGAAIFYGSATTQSIDIERDRKTTEALLLAKSALVSYAVAVNITTNATPIRLGDLPCPDTTNSGRASASGCGNSAGSTGQSSRIGRLPWKSLGLPDLRDGNGERLWYAVSNNFKENTRTICPASAPGAATCLNSDSRGTITVRDQNGAVLHDATNSDPASSGVIAVIFSPGAILRRLDGVQQNRDCGTDPTCAATNVCSGTTTPRCNPVNYLDTSGTEDNANFADGTTNGFINGIIRDANGGLVVNDRLLVLTYHDLMPQLEKRVAAEVSGCLVSYANANNGRYPWAAPVTTVASPLSDGVNTVFGRIPDQPFLQTQLGSNAITLPIATTLLQPACEATPGQCMSTLWEASCRLPRTATANSWWNNWKLQVFYGVADPYKPMLSFSQPTPTTVSLSGRSPPTGCPTCLTVSPNTIADKQFVVIVAGKSLSGAPTAQTRTNTASMQNPANYLEGENANVDSLFVKQSSSPTFNDVVLTQP